MTRWLVSILLLLCLRCSVATPCVAAEQPGSVGPTQAAPGAAPNLVRDPAGGPAKISVDSTFSGYGEAVLSDGRWIAKGRETTQDFGHPDRLGNRGNTWISGNAPGEHWIRLDWSRAVWIDEIQIWWSLAEFRPQAFRIERRIEGRWKPVDAVFAATRVRGAEAAPASAGAAATAGGAAGWEPTDRRSVIVFPATEAASLRIVQPAGAAGSRGLFGVQEILAFHRGPPQRASSGVRRMTSAEWTRPPQPPLVRNIASLALRWPGAAAPLAWLPDGAVQPASAVADEVTTVAAPLSPAAVAFGVQWPIAHMVDGAAVVFAGEVPAAESLVLEAFDGNVWRPVVVGLKTQRRRDAHRIDYAMEPLATTALRVRRVKPGGAAATPFSATDFSATPTEFEAYRYLPPRKDVWPERLVGQRGFAQQCLASLEEASFEKLAACALPMTSVRVALGLKDTLRETGVAWDGTLLGRETIGLRIGPDRYRMAEGRETLRRTLIDGWRPGVVIETRLGALAIRQTAFAVPVGEVPNETAVVLRVQVRNLSDRAVDCPVQAELQGDRLAVATVSGGTLRRGDDVVLIATGPSRQGDTDASLCVDLHLPPGGEASADFLHPQATCAPTRLSAYRSVALDAALPAFRRYWDELLAGAVRFEVPEPRVMRMQKAVLAQIFINGDGDIQYYGTEPSVYGDSLFGLEESYPMLALSLFGYPSDAQRYLDGTYMTPRFLKKAEKYTDVEDRHQQYRNGLEPHYAISAYRLSRDRAWIAKHWPLLRDCAQWTIAQRRKTMQLDGGKKPLHWGLLPAWAYGGDILDVTCYAFYGNLACWRGLADTAWLAEELGDRDAARRYADEARAYRVDIDRALEGAYRPNAKPPFMPLRLYTDKPDEQMDYYQLFAGAMLELDYFDLSDKHLRRIIDYLEASNRMFCLLPRFRRDVGAGGLDAIYGKGYFTTKLYQGNVREFLLAFYAFAAFNLDHETFVSRETNVLYASDLHARSVYGVIESSDPVPCSSAVALHMLRHMLVTEGRCRPDDRAGHLTFLAGVPRDWLADGRRIRIVDAPTHFGPASVDVQSAVASGRIDVVLVPPRRNPPAAMTLRLPHPAGKPIREVRIDGAAWSRFDAAAGRIELPATTADNAMHRDKPLKILVRYDR